MPKVKRVPEPPEVRSKEEKKPNVELSTEKRRKCYMWYARLGKFEDATGPTLIYIC